MKDIPRVFRNNINKEFNNNQTFSKEVRKDDSDINKKINDIFKSGNFVYKMDVVIKLENDVLKKSIIGKNKDSIITIDNELIPINKIIDIYPE